MALELIKISAFPEVTNPSEWIVVSDAEGTAYKISKENFKAFLGTVTVSAPKPIAPTDGAPELDGVYIPTVVGVYPNFGGLERLASDGYVQFLKNGTVYAKVNTPMPQPDLSGVEKQIDNLKSITPFYNSSGQANIPGGILKNGADTTATTYFRTDYIEVEPGFVVNYRIRLRTDNSGLFGIFLYNENKVLIKGVDPITALTATTVEGTYTVEAGVKFIRTSTMNAQHTDYVPYIFQLDIAIGLDLKPIKDKTDLLENYIVKLDMSSQTVIGSLTPEGLNFSNINYKRTDYIPAKENDSLEYRLRVGGVGYSAVHVFDSNKVKIASYGTSTGVNQTFEGLIKLPKKTGFVRITGMTENHAGYDFYVFKAKLAGINIVSDIQSEENPLVSGYFPNPILKCMKEESFHDGTSVKVSSYLYQNPENNAFFFAKSRYGKMEYAFPWDMSLSNGASPLDYSMGILGNGDIVCIYRSEILSVGNSTEANRRDPIIYQASEGYKGKIIDFTDRLKPTSWLQNSGFCFSSKWDCFFFAEYTRPSVKTANVWKVTAPFDNPENWRIVKSFTLSGNLNAGFKHIHKVEIDPYTSVVYFSTGDDSTAAEIYASTDQGESFQAVVTGSEKYCRELNFIYTKNYIYWATDSVGALHWFFRATRNASGVIQPSLIEDIHQFPASSHATYASIYLKAIGLIVFLNRKDGEAASVDIQGWDLINNQFVVPRSKLPICSAGLNFLRSNSFPFNA